MRHWNSGDAGLREMERMLRSGRGEAKDYAAYGRAAVRAGRLTAQQVDLLDSMGPDGWYAFLFGGEAEWRPSSSDTGAEFPYPVVGHDDELTDDAFVCTDPHGPDCHNDACPLHYGDIGPRTWVSRRAVDGLAVRRASDGSPMIVRTHWTVDDAGNWDAGPEDSWSVDSREAEAERLRRAIEIADLWLDYFTWVEAQERDPLNRLEISQRRTPDTSWRFLVEESSSGFSTIRRAWRRSRNRWVPVRLEAISAEAREVLGRNMDSEDVRSTMTKIPGLGGRAPGIFYAKQFDVLELAPPRDPKLRTPYLGILEITVPGTVVPPGPQEIAEAAILQRSAAAFAGQELTRRLSALAGGPWFIYDDDTGLFWNNEDGWVGYDDAQMFTDREGLRLPPHGQWIETRQDVAHSEDCYCMECVHEVGFCEGCLRIPGEGSVMDEHEVGCDQEGKIVCAQHHVCGTQARIEPGQPGLSGSGGSVYMTGGRVQVCGWCPQPNNPDPRFHPGGQAEHLLGERND